MSAKEHTELYDRLSMHKAAVTEYETALAFA